MVWMLLAVSALGAWAWAAQSGSAPAPAGPAGISAAATPGATPAATPAPGQTGMGLQALFLQSFDLFTALLVLGSVVAGAVAVRAVLEVRTGVILPVESERTIRRLSREGQRAELGAFVERDGAFVSRVVRAALSVPASGDAGEDRAARREAAELAASEECAGWFRRIEPLNVLGNLGPLLGLAGTVWGMVIAFASLGQSGGQANPATLSVGIAKALFHTLLGLMLALPALTVFGFYRTRVDKLCNRALTLSAELVEGLPAPDDAAAPAPRPAPSRAGAEASEGFRPAAAGSGAGSVAGAGSGAGAARSPEA